ncbi:MAG: cell division protein FtsA [Alistipes sp.]|nr:cell division protein FtsA [Alistipes sp.]
MDKKNYIVAIDIGSSEVVVAVGSLAEGGAVNVEAIVSENTEGMVAGLVDNSQMVADALRRARARAEEQAGISIVEAYVTISGKFVRCARYTDYVFVKDAENRISKHDLTALHEERMSNVKAADGETIMDFFPLCYKSDSGQEMKNPVGSYSKQLSATYNFILCEHMAKDRLRRVFMDVGIRIKELYAGAAVVAESVVNTDERDEGVAIVDIGSGVTDVSIYYGGVLCYIASIPIGGSALNTDIRMYDGYIPPRLIESLKCQLGSAVVSLTPDEMIQVRSRNRNLKSIPRLNLASVIEARMTDIAEYVWKEIRDAGYAKKLGAGIVLTGGVADLANVAELFHRVTGQETRTACPEIGITSESFEMVATPKYTLAVSLLLRGSQAGVCPVGVYIPPVQPKVEEKKVEQVPPVVQQPKEPEVNKVVEPAKEEKATPKPEVQPEPEKKTLNDKWSGYEEEDDVPEEDDDDIKSSGWGIGAFFRRAKDKFSNAFNDPNDGVDEDERW